MLHCMELKRKSNNITVYVRYSEVVADFTREARDEVWNHKKSKKSETKDKEDQKFVAKEL